MTDYGSKKALDTAVRKKAVLDRELIIAVDPSVKFKLREEIKELEAEISRLGGSRRYSAKEGAPGRFGVFTAVAGLLIVAGIVAAGFFGYRKYRDNAYTEALTIAARQLDNDQFAAARNTLSAVDPLHEKLAVSSMIDSIRYYESAKKEVTDALKRGEDRSRQNKHEAAVAFYAKALKASRKADDKALIQSLIDEEKKAIASIESRKRATPPVIKRTPPTPANSTGSSPAVKPKPVALGQTEFIRIPGGRFTIGDVTAKSVDAPPVELEVKSFQIGAHEVTNKEYCRFLNARPEVTEAEIARFFPNGLAGGGATRIMRSGGEYVPSSGYENHPVVGVSWYGADAFARHYKWRLPTEVEWEYAAGCNSSGTYSGGADLDGNGWYRSNAHGKVRAVQSKRANACGVFDMSGNVGEWCANNYDREAYEKIKAGGSLAFTDGVRKARRGGGADDGAQACSIFYRKGMYPQLASQYLGFRVAK